MKKAVVLLSGGLDSATTLAIARQQGYLPCALSFAYGQRHSRELESAKRVAAALGAREHLILSLDLRLIGGSALTADIPVPKGRSPEEIGSGIPVTYVPARNTIFLAHALGWAEVLGAEDIFFGANVLDYSVSGDAQVWVRSARWANLMPMREFFELPEDDYETVAVDPKTLKLGWRRVTGRFRHRTDHKRCFSIRLERGQEITITEDHSLYTIDPATARLVTVKGSQITKGMPIVVPFDLSAVTEAWKQDLRFLDLSGPAESCRPVSFRAQRSAFVPVPALHSLVSCQLALLRVTDIRGMSLPWMYDLSVEGTENFVANGILAHNSGYPDCRPEYLEAFERLAALGTKAGVERGWRLRIHTPLITMTKAEIIRTGHALGVDFSLTWSCYDPASEDKACGRCDSCLLRKKGFAEAGLTDPLPYVT